MSLPVIAVPTLQEASEAVRRRTDELFALDIDAVYRRADRLFALLMAGQWAFAVALALLVSPYGWEGKVRSTHVHVWAALLLGGALSSLPLALIALRPGAALTRHVVACAQMLWSALLIHLTGGRIETHFHVFGSLAFLSFYRDWRVLLPATLVVTLDHGLRGVLWPESVYGTSVVTWWRFLEHSGWVVFENVVLFFACRDGARELRVLCQRRAELEQVSESERRKSRALDAALAELRASQQTVLRAERLAAIGQLAASVGHELRNPLGAIRNAGTFIGRRLRDQPETAARDPRVVQFVALIDREVGVCNRILSDLLDFARDRPASPAPCPLRPLVDEAISVLPPSPASVVNAVPEALPIPDLDRELFRQVLINLIQNAIEAFPEANQGRVVVEAQGGASEPLLLSIADNGPGVPADVAPKIFEPLFTTKVKGTGLGLAIVANIVRAHGGRIRLANEPGGGARFSIELPRGPAPHPTSKEIQAP